MRPRALHLNTLIDLNVVSIMINIVDVLLRLFLTFEQQQTGSAQKHAMSLINYGDTGDSEDIDECE